MQIFELTQPKQRKLNEYDPSRSPPGTPNYAAGGAGTAPQMTAAPGTTATAPVTATSNYSGGQQTAAPTTNQSAPATAAAPAPATDPVDAAARIMAQQRAAAKPNYSGKQPAPAPTPAPAATTDYSAGAYNQTSNVPPATVPATNTAMPSNMQPAAPQAAPAPAPAPLPSQPTYNAPTANVPATNTVMPSNMSTTGAPAAAPAAGINPELAAAGKVGLAAAPGRKANIGGAIANAMMKHNAGQTGLGFMLPKDADNEVYVDRTGQITVGGKPYDPKNPEHQRAAGNITIGGKPYNGANPEHRAAYMAFKNIAGRGGSDTVKIDKDGKITVLGQPFNPANPGHVQAYRDFMLGSSVKATPPAAPQAAPAATQQRPAQPPAAAAGSPEVIQALEKMGYTTQQAAALAAKVPRGTTTSDAVKQVLQGRITESLTWSRGFDPSATLLKKMKSQ